MPFIRVQTEKSQMEDSIPDMRQKKIQHMDQCKQRPSQWIFAPSSTYNAQVLAVRGGQGSVLVVVRVRPSAEALIWVGTRGLNESATEQIATAVARRIEDEALHVETNE